MSGEIWIIFGLILLNGLLAGAEIAVVTIRPSRVRELVHGGHRAARVLQRLREKPESFLATVQVGITLVGASAAAYGGATLADDLTPVLTGWGLSERSAAATGVGLVIAVVAFLSVVLGELVPKSLALRSSERYALLMARPLALLAKLAAPVVWLFTAASNLVLALFRDRTTFTEVRLSLAEVRSLVDEASDAGTVVPAAGEIASRALDFAALTAAEVMVHRRFVVALPRDADATRLREALLGAGHRRIPIFEGTLDSPVGYVTWRDALARVWSGAPLVLEEMLRPAQLVPQSMPAIDLLKRMQARRVHMAFVVDEHGGLSGIVTLEDLLEELVGDIVSEHDAPPQAAVMREADGGILVAGATALRDVDRELDTALDAIDDSTSMGGLCTALAGERIPRVGERVRAGAGVEIEILEASARRVKMVRLHVRPLPAS